MYSVIYILFMDLPLPPLGYQATGTSRGLVQLTVMKNTGPTLVHHQDPPVARGSRHIRLLRAPTVGCQITDSSQGWTRGGHRLHPITDQEFQSSECSKPAACI